MRIYIASVLVDDVDSSIIAIFDYTVGNLIQLVYLKH